MTACAIIAAGLLSAAGLPLCRMPDTIGCGFRSMRA